MSVLYIGVLMGLMAGVLVGKWLGRQSGGNNARGRSSERHVRGNPRGKSPKPRSQDNSNGYLYHVAAATETQMQKLGLTDRVVRAQILTGLYKEYCHEWQKSVGVMVCFENGEWRLPRTRVSGTGTPDEKPDDNHCKMNIDMQPQVGNSLNICCRYGTWYACDNSYWPDDAFRDKSWWRIAFLGADFFKQPYELPALKLWQRFQSKHAGLGKTQDGSNFRVGFAFYDAIADCFSVLWCKSSEQDGVNNWQVRVDNHACFAPRTVSLLKKVFMRNFSTLPDPVCWRG